ncbi:MAG TPA: hypothetical protein VFY84_18500 [Jiangellales bacterium]|nr:hypothetical protein [Jiangellales bacterium]
MSTSAPPPVAHPPTTAQQFPPGRPWTAGRITALVLGSILALVSLGLLVTGLIGLIYDQTQRDSDGFLVSDRVDFESNGYAVVAGGLTVDTSVPGWLQAENVIGDIRLTVESADGSPVFLGVAEQDAVQPFLADLAYDEVREISGFGHTVTYAPHTGAAPAAMPADADVWTAWTAGPGEQTVTVELEAGDWVAVAMNADGSAGVDVTGTAAAEVPILTPVAIGLLVAGAIGLAASAIPIFLALRSRTTRGQPV